MSDLTRCSQTGCDRKAAFLFTWPGNDQKGIFITHGLYAKQVADAMQFHLQLLPIEVTVECGEEAARG